MTATDSHPTDQSTRDNLPIEPATILVADDEHLVASGIAGHLSELGYHVIGPASDGDEAIKLCQAVQPDLALLDIRMPARDGIQAAEEIFSQFAIPVIILSAYSDPDYVEGARSGGVFGYLLKPVTQDQLRVAISVAWSRYLGYMELTDQIHTLKERLEHRKTIEQAKWVIVKRKGIEEPDAMRLLQRQARNNRRSLIEVARSVLDNEDLFGEGEET
jgi:response regulator NasT